MDFYLIFGICFVLFLLCLSMIKTYLNQKQLNYFIKNFTDYITLLNYHMEKAYQIVHKDKMLIYSVEAIKIDDQQFNQYAKEFAILVMQLLGPTLEKEFNKFYGNEETFYFNLIEYFNTQYEDDGIRESSVANLMEQD